MRCQPVARICDHGPRNMFVKISPLYHLRTLLDAKSPPQNGSKIEPNPPVAQPPSCHSLLCQPPQRVVLQITNALLRPCEVMVSYSSQSQRLQTG